MAVVLDKPRTIAMRRLELTEPGPEDIVVEVTHSGISTGTEKLFWTGGMPAFPGMGYPLVPGYEAVGEVVEAPRGARLRPGERVFVPGAACYRAARGLFGGNARRVVTHPDRAIRVDCGLEADGTLIALAATARHAIAGLGRPMPELIVGHGVLGRLLARLTLAAGAPAPMVWETAERRRAGARGYPVLAPEDDPRRDYGCIFDASGSAGLLDTLIGRLRKGGEIVLAGFYAEPLSFAFPAAFLKEARLRVAAEWTRDDLAATRALIESGALSLAGLLTHRRPAAEADRAYPVAFEDPDCLKMVLDWEAVA
jgi:3-hydroxyethyl bacteriochlorophyllide a dehydrogenase